LRVRTIWDSLNPSTIKLEGL